MLHYLCALLDGLAHLLVHRPVRHAALPAAVGHGPAARAHLELEARLTPAGQ